MRLNLITNLKTLLFKEKLFNSEEYQHLIIMDMETETINYVLSDLRNQIKLLENQNENMRLKLDEENTKGLEMANLLRARRPFNRTKAGEFIFPGKKDMELKLDIMTKEISKLKKILDDFHKDRCRMDLTQEIFKSITCFDNDENTDDTAKKQLINELDEQYNTMKEDFDKKILEISKYRVKLDTLKKDFDANEKRLRETQILFNEASTQIEKLESTGESREKNEQILKHKLNEAKDRLNSLESVEDYQMDELNAKKKSYMDAIHEKEYQILRANNLCIEKERMTTEFETEFDRVKEYYKKRLKHVEYCPITLQALQRKLFIQKETKTSVEKTIDIMSKKLKSIIGDSCGDSIKLKQFMKLKAHNSSLKKEQEKMEKVLGDIQKRREEIKRSMNEQKNRLDNIKNETTSKINEIRDTLKRPTEEYLQTMDKIQIQIAKIEGYAYFEDGKIKLVSSMMLNQIDVLASILKNAQENIAEIENLQNYLEATQMNMYNVLNCKELKFN